MHRCYISFKCTVCSCFAQVAAEAFRKQTWKKLLKVFRKASLTASSKLSAALSTNGSASVQPHVEGDNLKTESKSFVLKQRWAEFLERVSRAECNLPKIEHGFAFTFADGLLVRAMKEGSWLLLDEINLATPETLQALAGVLDGRSLLLTETGNLKPIERHPNFRIFAAMNPPTDIGKRELSAVLRSRFTEIFVTELTDVADLQTVVTRYLIII